MAEDLDLNVDIHVLHHGVLMDQLSDMQKRFGTAYTAKTSKSITNAVFMDFVFVLIVAGTYRTTSGALFKDWADQPDDTGNEYLRFKLPLGLTESDFK